MWQYGIYVTFALNKGKHYGSKETDYINFER